MATSPELELPSPPSKLKLRIPAPPQPETEKAPPSSPENNNDDDEKEEEEECHTPTSSENKIPIISICPPAPKKTSKFSDFPKKRRISELELIRVSSDLMERLFRPLEDPTAAPLVLKRRKRCYPG